MDLRMIPCQNQSEGRRERFCATLDFINTKITRICSYTAQLNQTRTSRRNRAALTTNPTPLYMEYTRSLTILNTKNLSGIGRGYAAYLVYRVHWLHADTAQSQNKEDLGSSSAAICYHECNHLVPQKHSRSLLWDWGWELDGSPSSSSSMSADTTEKHRSKKQRLTPDGVGMRSDGQWIEQEINIELDEQCLEGKEKNVSIEFRGFTRSHRCQIIIEGIEIRPKGMGKFKSWLN